MWHWSKSSKDLKNCGRSNLDISAAEDFSQGVWNEGILIWSFKWRIIGGLMAKWQIDEVMCPSDASVARLRVLPFRYSSNFLKIFNFAKKFKFSQIISFSNRKKWEYQEIKCSMRNNSAQDRTFESASVRPKEAVFGRRSFYLLKVDYFQYIKCWIKSMRV